MDRRLRIDKEQNSFLLIHKKEVWFDTTVFIFWLFLFFAPVAALQKRPAFEVFSTEQLPTSTRRRFLWACHSDGVKYLPLDLPDEFKQDGLKVDFFGVLAPF